VCAPAPDRRDKLAALMITYPSTHGVYEDGVDEICRIIHDNGGQVGVGVGGGGGELEDVRSALGFLGLAAPGGVGCAAALVALLRCVNLHSPRLLATHLRSPPPLVPLPVFRRCTWTAPT
jgi:hypothetical protein